MPKISEYPCSAILLAARIETMDVFIVVPLMLSGYEAIDHITEDENHPDLETLRSTIILVAKGLYEQRRNHYAAEALFHVIRGRM